MLQINHETGKIYINIEDYNIGANKITIRKCGSFPVNGYGDFDERALFDSNFDIDVDFYDAVTADGKSFFSSRDKPTENEIRIALDAYNNNKLFLKIGIVAAIVILFLLLK
jgi:hypothetical protein